MAITWYATDDTVARRYQILVVRSVIRRNTPGSLTDFEQREMHSWCRVLCSALVERLGRGELVARARVGVDIASKTIPADFWRRVILDLDANTAEADGIFLRALAIFDAKVDDGLRAATDTAQSRAVAWMRENVTSYVPKQRDGMVAACQKALSIKKDAALQGWNALPEAIKGVPRTPKN